MNITEFAKMRGIGKTTIYRKIKEFGYTPQDIRGEGGELTDEALSILAAVLDGTQKRPDFPPAERVPWDVPQVERVSQLERELRETREKLEEAEKRINELLQQAADRERQNAENWRSALERLQTIEEQKLLPGAAHDGRTIWQKLFGRNNKG